MFLQKIVTLKKVKQITNVYCLAIKQSLENGQSGLKEFADLRYFVRELSLSLVVLQKAEDDLVLPILPKQHRFPRRRKGCYAEGGHNIYLSLHSTALRWVTAPSISFTSHTFCVQF